MLQKCAMTAAGQAGARARGGFEVGAYKREKSESARNVETEQLKPQQPCG